MSDEQHFRDVESIEKISGAHESNIDEVNKKLKNGYVLIGLAVTRHPRPNNAFTDEEFYIIGKRRGPNY